VGRVREYELVVVLSPALEEAKVAASMERVQRFITERGGTLTKQEPWGTRRLAYPIRHFKEGNYFLTQFTMDGDHTHALSSSLGISEDVLRHLLVKVEN
jgi:small subunit ribosomal protein S6